MSLPKLLHECPEHFATKYDEAKPIFLVGKMSADHILSEEMDNDSVTFEVSMKLAKLYKLLTFFESQVLKPSTDKRLGKMNKRRLDILKSLQNHNLRKTEKILLLQVWRYSKRK